jgi:hypothetical protein
MLLGLRNGHAHPVRSDRFDFHELPSVESGDGGRAARKMVG